MASVRIGVIGCGRMGCSIAAWLACRGCDIVMFDETEFTRNRALQSVKGQLAENVQKYLLTIEDAEKAQAKIRVSDTLEGATEVDLVVEAIPDDVTLKRGLFAKLDQIAPPRCILTTNSINYLITDVASKEARHACCGVRFLFPVFFVKKVEVSSGDTHIWGNTDLEEHNRVPPYVRVSALLSSVGLDPFVYTLGSRFLLSDMDVERINAEQRRIVSLQTSRDPGMAMYVSDGRPSKGPLKAKTGECAICCEDAEMAFLLPCGHTGFCVPCALSLLNRNCYYCRAKVERVLPMTD